MNYAQIAQRAYRQELHELHAAATAEGYDLLAHDCSLVLDRAPGWRRARRRVERALVERALGIHIEEPINYRPEDDED